jgi:hypothetical protein
VQGNCTAQPADALLEKARKAVSPDSLEPLHPGQCLIICSSAIFARGDREEASREPGFVDNLYLLSAKPNDGSVEGISINDYEESNFQNMYILRTTLDGMQYRTGFNTRAYVEGESQHGLRLTYEYCTFSGPFRPKLW